MSEIDNAGARNLLENCLALKPNEKVLLVCEDAKYGWYDNKAPNILADAIKQNGGHVTIQKVGAPDEALPVDYPEKIADHDSIIYLARIGDQGRFYDNLPNKKAVMLYARDEPALSSPFAAINHQAMKQFKRAFDEVSLAAKQITITCPLGTNLVCAQDEAMLTEAAEVMVQRFPLSVPQPVLAKKMSGQVAIAFGLTSTGSQYYSPAICTSKDTVFADVENGKILGFRGDAACVAAIEKHYEFVANQFSIDKQVVHSWHAGIHPACAYDGRIEDDRDRWANNIFGSPRYVHFHTCGDYPPGEICWMVLDPTITLDGVALWENGHLKPERFKKTASVLNEWPELKELMAFPDLPIGF